MGTTISLRDRLLQAIWPGNFSTSGTISVRASAQAVPQTIAYCGLGPRPKPRYRTRLVSLRQHMLAAGRTATTLIRWREGSQDRLASRFVFPRLRVAGRRPRLNQDGSLPLRWVLAQWPDDQPEPIKY